MLERVGVVAHDDLGQVAQLFYGISVELDCSERRGESADAGQREPAHGDPMRRTEQNHALDGAADRREPGVRIRRDRSRVNVARVRNDERFRHRRVLAAAAASISCTLRASDSFSPG